MIAFILENPWLAGLTLAAVLTAGALWLVWGPRFKPDHHQTETGSYAKRADSARAFDPELQADGDAERWLSSQIYSPEDGDGMTRWQYLVDLALRRPG